MTIAGLPKGESSSKAYQTIVITGANGFIGSRLVARLASDADNLYQIRSMGRTEKEIKLNTADKSKSTVDFVKADASNYTELVDALRGADCAYYLIHSMSGSSKEWKQFAERDRIAADNFAKAATECNVKRIIYLSGLGPQSDDAKGIEVSAHMHSREEVGRILQTSTAKVTIFRAAVILGYGGGSFEMLRYLVERLPVMVTPKWVLTKSQPIAVDDVVEYLARAITGKATESRTFDIGGPEILTYIDMMRRYAQSINKSIRIVIIPFLTPRLSSYWIDLVTPLPASLARPLIDSLKHEATVTDDSIKNIIPLNLKTFDESIRKAKEEQTKDEAKSKSTRARLSASSKVLIASLIALAALGATYYTTDSRTEVVFQPHWLALGAIWYAGIAFAAYFTLHNARLGPLIAGAIGWITLPFWLLDNLYLFAGNNSLLAESPDVAITIRNFVGSLVVIITIVASHVVFHNLHKK
jgi:uncharacterized protein YbjT (DUF2867 family)